MSGLDEVLAAPPGPDPTTLADVGRLLARLDPRSAGIAQAAAPKDEAAFIGTRLRTSEGAVRVALRRLAAMGRGGPL